MAVFPEIEQHFEFALAQTTRPKIAKIKFCASQE